ncbi:MAG: hypothetical protein ILA24_02270 [Ruminococcus sp.]|nr:hypothetical protein [Ruminococcus sp.]
METAARTYVGDYVDYFPVSKLTKKDLERLEEQDFNDTEEKVWDKDYVNEVLHPEPEEQPEPDPEPEVESEEETIFDRIRAEFERTEQLTDEEIEQLIFGLLTEYYAAQDEADEYDD